MKFIKISLLSLLILFLGIFGIIVGTSVNSISNVSFLNSESKMPVIPVEDELPVGDGISMKFDENYWEDDGNGNGKLYVEADWSSTNELPNATTQIEIKETTGPWTPLTIVSVGDTTEYSFTETVVENTTYWHYEATINNKNDSVNKFKFSDNSTYDIYIKISGNSSQNVKFITPSKSVINYTNTTGTVKNVTDKEVIIDTSLIQDEQRVSDDIYAIDENLELTLKTGSSTEFGDIDITDSEITKVTGLEPGVEYNWTIVGSYYNGTKQVELEEIPI